MDTCTHLYEKYLLYLLKGKVLGLPRVFLNQNLQGFSFFFQGFSFKTLDIILVCTLVYRDLKIGMAGSHLRESDLIRLESDLSLNVLNTPQMIIMCN